MQHTVIVLLGLGSLVSAIASAFYWFIKSAAVPTKQSDEPVAPISDVPEANIFERYREC